MSSFTKGDGAESQTSRVVPLRAPRTQWCLNHMGRRMVASPRAVSAGGGGVLVLAMSMVQVAARAVMLGMRVLRAKSISVFVMS